jgi:hypothetical protein
MLKQILALTQRLRVGRETLKRHCLVFAGLVLASNVTMAQNWVPSGPLGKPVIPFDAIIAGRDTPAIKGFPGPPLYVCRGGTAEGYGLQVGKFRAGFTGCDIGYGGLEITVPDFQFLVTSWQDASSGSVPSNAVIGGYDIGGHAGDENAFSVQIRPRQNLVCS